MENKKYYKEFFDERAYAEYIMDSRYPSINMMYLKDDIQVYYPNVSAIIKTLGNELNGRNIEDIYNEWCEEEENRINWEDDHLFLEYIEDEYSEELQYFYDDWFPMNNYLRVYDEYSYKYHDENDLAPFGIGILEINGGLFLFLNQYGSCPYNSVWIPFLKKEMKIID